MDKIERKLDCIKPPFSFSRISACDTCRYKAYKKYVLKVEGEYDSMANVGSKFHRVMELYAKHCIEKSLTHDLDAIPVFLRKLEGSLSFEEWEGFRTAAEIFMFNDRFPQGNVVAEWECGLDADWKPVKFDDPNAYVRSKLDLLFISGNKAKIVDYKTGFKIQTIKNAETMFQLNFYALMVFLHFPEIEEIEVMNKYVRYHIPVWDTVKRSAIPKIQETINTKILDIMSDTEFLPKIQDHCRVCNLSGMCEYFQKYVAESSHIEIKNVSEAEILAKKIYATGIALKKWKVALKAFIKKHGAPVLLGEKDLVYGASAGRVKSVKDHIGAAKFLISQGLDKNKVWEMAGFDYKDLVNLLKVSGKADLIPFVTEKFVTISPREKWGPICVSAVPEEEGPNEDPEC